MICARSPLPSGSVGVNVCVCVCVCALFIRCVKSLGRSPYVEFLAGTRVASLNRSPVHSYHVINVILRGTTQYAIFTSSEQGLTNESTLVLRTVLYDILLLQYLDVNPIVKAST